MLAALAPASLARLRFPLGELRKPQVRELAREAGLPVADKRESQDLCFLAGTGKSAFLARHGGVRERPGAIVDRAGRAGRRARGQHLFTIGQRKGLGVAAEEPLFVLRKDRDANTVTVGTRAELATHGGRGARRGPAPPARPRSTASSCATARSRSACRVRTGDDGRLALALAEPVDGAAPGPGRLPDARRRDRRPRRHRLARQMTSDEIRERFLSYFAERGHERLPSAPLVPRNDPSTLLISAGMHPLKPYFLGARGAAGATG